MNFKNYINLEEKTIEEFINQKEAITLNELKNDSFSVYDFTFFSGGTYNGYFTPILDGICEVKTRKNKSTDYPEGALIELKKITNVCNQVAIEKDKNINKNIKPFYLSKYKDKSFLFDLEKVNLGNIQFRKCPKVTATDYIVWIFKPVLILPFEDAILIY